jgi:hypothetical protein
MQRYIQRPGLLRRSAPPVFHAVTPDQSSGSAITVSTKPAPGDKPMIRTYPTRLFGSGSRTMRCRSSAAPSDQPGSMSSAPDSAPAVRTAAQGIARQIGTHPPG